MEDSLRQRVVGQDHVVASISNAVRISRAGLQAPNRPVASFLLLGPTGVGKVSLIGERLPCQGSDGTFCLIDGVVQGAGCIFIQR
jgi:DNA polymerase III gamma/tau subunit